LDDCPNFLCRTEFFFKEPIGFTYWRHFYIPYLGRRNKASHSEWHTERAPQGKKVNSVEETSSLSDKIDAIMFMHSNDRAHVDPNNVPLASLVAQEEHVDVNLIRNNNFNNSAYRNNFASNNYRLFPSNGDNSYLGRPKMPSEERILEVERATENLCRCNMSRTRCLPRPWRSNLPC
jgi:hypothetical protein